MGILTKIFASPTIRAVRGVIDELDYAYSQGDLMTYAAFKDIRDNLRRLVDNDPGRVEKYIADNAENNINPRVWVVSTVNNFAGNILVSGQHHVYRGVLSAYGNALLALFLDTNAKLVDLKSIDSDYAKEQVAGIKKSIAIAG